jgi:hypothetical protein
MTAVRQDLRDIEGEEVSRNRKRRGLHDRPVAIENGVTLRSMFGASPVVKVVPVLVQVLHDSDERVRVGSANRSRILLVGYGGSGGFGLGQLIITNINQSVDDSSVMSGYVQQTSHEYGLETQNEATIF